VPLETLSRCANWIIAAVNAALTRKYVVSCPTVSRLASRRRRRRRLLPALYQTRHGNLPAGGGLPVERPDAAGCDPGFTYPPFFALVMLPFAPMPMWLRDLVWYVVTVAATIGAVKFTEIITGKALASPLQHCDDVCRVSPVS
jgi:hypothetical protein